MTRRPAAAGLAVGTALALALTGCTGTGSPSGAGAAFNAGIDKVFHASTAKGGTLRFANSADWDSLDPADTYYAYSWNFLRFYTRSLVTVAVAPGAKGTKLIPDLAESLGKPSDGGKTWTYTVRKGVKFEDGTPVTSKDVKYAVERSLDKDTFPNGPTYFNDFLDLQGYASPYKDASPDKLGLRAVETPDDRTVVFHLRKAFSGFDYLAMLPGTAPVPRAKDTGTKYREHVLSTGPYKFETYEPGKRFTLVRNEQWDPATDPNRPALPDRIEVQLNMNAADIDQRLLAGDLDLDVTGSGVGPATQGKVLADRNLKKNLDSAQAARLWFTSINPDVAPLNDIHCRKAVAYATDHEGYQRAYGGEPGGDIATNLIPPVVPGAGKFDLYDFIGKKNGDVEAAKKELAQCGQPGGFAATMSYRSGRPKEKALAESMQQSLAAVGIKLTLKPFPDGDYFKLYAGKPGYAKQNNLGLIANGWGADWPDGFGFLQQIVDSRTIRASGGNTNLGVRIPEVDRMVDEVLRTTDAKAREAIWTRVDKRVMEEAVILPGVWARGLLYRPPTLRNAFVTDYFQMYDYIALGVK